MLDSIMDIVQHLPQTAVIIGIIWSFKKFVFDKVKTKVQRDEGFMDNTKSLVALKAKQEKIEKEQDDLRTAILKLQVNDEKQDKVIDRIEEKLSMKIDGLDTSIRDKFNELEGAINTLSRAVIRLADGKDNEAVKESMIDSNKIV